ncbi:MAG: hypothetical protein KIT28_09870 [Rubrivivax sp.]|nr:hypothetical protein [Rubrivivax sp.]HRY89345.1 hypothetical protein [Rubrivivax sp.]
MRRMNSGAGAVIAALLVGLIAAAPPARAEDDALAALDAGQRRVVQKFLAKQAADGASASADAVRVHDLDGDGQPEMVVVWTSYFGNSSASSLSVLAVGRISDGKRLWREASTVPLDGIDPRLDIRGAALRVDTLTLGPKDARCCPTRKVHREWAYRGGKLAAP